MNKLRMTGFECFTAFVIRRAKHIPEGTRPAISDKSYVSELDKIDEFPNRTSAAYFSFYLYRKYRYSFLISKNSRQKMRLQQANLTTSLALSPGTFHT